MSLILFVSRIWQVSLIRISLKKPQKNGLDSIQISLKLEIDKKHCFNTNECQRSGFSHLLFIELFFKNHTYYGRGMHSPSALVLDLPYSTKKKKKT